MTAPKPFPTAAAVSSKLRKQGLLTVGSGSTRQGIKVREGIRGVVGPVVRVDFDAPSTAVRMMGIVVEALDAAGISHGEPSDNIVRVTR